MSDNYDSDDDDEISDGKASFTDYGARGMFELYQVCTRVPTTLPLYGSLPLSNTVCPARCASGLYKSAMLLPVLFDMIVTSATCSCLFAV